MRLLVILTFIIIESVLLINAQIRHPISHDQQFIIPQQCETGDYVGVFYINFTEREFNSENIDLSYNFKIVSGNAKGIFRIEESIYLENNEGAIIMINDPSNIEPGEVILEIRISHYNSVEFYKAKIRIIETQKCVFVDPYYTGDENGSLTNPHNNWITDVQGTYQAGYAYFQKR